MLFTVPLVYILTFFWGVGFYNSFDTFFGVWFMLIMISECATGLGLMISAGSSDVQAAQAVSNLIVLPSMLFGGLFVNDSTIFKALSWLQYISPIRYAFNSILIAEFKPQGLSWVYEFLGFSGLTYWECIACLAALTILGRIGSLIILYLNISKF